MKRSISVLAVIVVLGVSVGCFRRAPRSFVRVMEPTWSSVEIREEMDTETAWKNVVDVLAKKFELAQISKDGMYLRTGWIYTWAKAGQMTEYYRVRAIVKFSPDMTQIDLKTEANYYRGDWIVGTDTRLLKTVKTDIMGVIGRTTR